MGYVRVYVRIESIFIGRRRVPGIRRLLFGQADADDRLDAFEAVLPRHDETDGSSILIGQCFAINAHCQNCE